MVLITQDNIYYGVLRPIKRDLAMVVLPCITVGPWVRPSWCSFMFGEEVWE